MPILVLTYALNGILMIAIPIFLAIFLTRRWKTGWRIWWIGSATFILSQLVHIPFNWGIGILLNKTGMVYWSVMSQRLINAVFLGLSAGIFEETARYLMLLLGVKTVRSWRKAIIFGAGHGAIEAIIMGILVLISYISLLVMKQMDLSTILPASQIALAQDQISAYWSAPWYESLLGALERLLALPLHIALAVLVMQSFLKKNIGWLFIAILYHALIDATATFTLPWVGPYWTEAILGIFTLMSILIIFFLRQPDPVVQTFLPSNERFISVRPIEETKDIIENTQYEN